MEYMKVKLVLGENMEIEGKPGDNMNAIAVGPPGIGKTYSFMTPNIREADNCSLFVDDKKGNLYEQHKDYLEQNGYKVFCFDMVNFQGNMHYNIFSSITERNDTKRLVNFLFPESMGGNDLFWLYSARELAECLIEIGRVAIEKFSIEKFIDLLNSTSSEGHESGVKYNPDKIDMLYVACDKKNQIDRAYRKYQALRKMATDTWSSVRGTCISLCAALDHDGLFTITDETSIDLDMMGKEKVAIFVKTSDTDSSLAPMVQILYRDICSKLIIYADTECRSNKNLLPYHVRFMLDDFASGVRMDNFENMIANCRSRNISFLLGIQSLAQLEAIYGKKCNTIMDCMSYKVYFASCNQSTIEYISTVMDIPTSEVRQMQAEDVCIEMLGQCPAFYKRYSAEQDNRRIRR